MAYFDNDDTIFAPATVPGTGAISLIRVSGSRAIEIADKVVSCQGDQGDSEAIVAETGVGARVEVSRSTAPETRERASGGGGESAQSQSGIAAAKGYTIKFGTVNLPTGELLDEVLVSIFRAPHSYTGEDSVEISCHASSYIVSELSALLSSHGARQAQPGEFTRRAFLGGKMDLMQAEAVADVIASGSAAAHRVAISQMKGGISSELREMRSELLSIVSLMELELDFSEEDVQFADREKLGTLIDKTLGHINRLADTFRTGNAIKNGVPTAIVGATNVGKSTLLNALLGEARAIVSDISGTTRDTIEEILTLGGIPFRIIDTAGLREDPDTIEKIGIERTRKKVAEAEIVLGIVDATRSESEIRSEVEQLLSLVKAADKLLFVIFNKVDALEEGAGTRDAVEDRDGTYSMDCSAGPSSDSPGSTDRDGKDSSLRDDVTSGERQTPTSNKCVKNLYKIVSCIENKGIKSFFISAKTGIALDGLKDALVNSQKDRIDGSEAVLVTNIRHYEALRRSAESLNLVKQGLAAGLPSDLVSQDLREALDTIGSITGEITSAEILSSIFSKFCIGK